MGLKKLILFPYLLSSSSWANNKINRDRLTRENQIVVCLGNSHKPENTKDSEAHWVRMTFWIKEKMGEGDRVLYFRSQKG